MKTPERQPVVDVPHLRLGVSRVTRRRKLSLWETILSLLGQRPAPTRPVVVPRPPRSVLHARTLAELPKEEN